MFTPSIYINLPAKDLASTRQFWSALGFIFKDEYSDDKAACLVLNESTYAMLVAREHFASFTPRPIADGSHTQAIVALEQDSRATVDELVARALELGATRYASPTDIGWMYYDSFADPDGHQWELMWMDAAQIPQE